MLTRLVVSLAVVVVIGAGRSVEAAAAPLPPLEPLDHAVCRLIADAARANDLPVAFMTRVIWRESSFRAAAISPKGAEGIAQFMPATADERGLRDPFDPALAIPKAASLLAELRARFGNLGLAAAAYNAGPARVVSWLKGSDGGLPFETRDYVRFVTLRDVAEWLPAGDPADSERALPGSCLATIGTLRAGGPGGGEAEDPHLAPLAPWGVQLAGNFSKDLALAEFARAERRYASAIGERQPMIIGRRLRYLGTRTFYQVRLPALTRSAADLLCGRIRAIGGVCVALRS